MKASTFLVQISNSRTFCGDGPSTSTSDYYMFGASREMVATVATRAQTVGKSITFATSDVASSPRAGQSGPVD